VPTKCSKPYNLIQLGRFTGPRFSAIGYNIFIFSLKFMQIINVYNQEYESGAAFWPDVHGRVITALVISQLALMGLMSTKEAAQSTPFLIALPVLTIWFHRFCNGRHKSAFVKYPLQVCWCLHTVELMLFVCFDFSVLPCLLSIDLPA
jgi:hypothetical protein